MISRFGGFAANGVVTGVATIVSIALIVNLLGAREWSTFAIAQAAGLLAAVVVGFGWAVIGPATVAQLSPQARVSEFTIAVWVRVGIFVTIVTIVSVLYSTGVLGNSAAFLPVALAYASTGFSSLWFYVGTGEAWASFTRDAVPRAIASVVAPLAALLGPPQLILGLVVLGGNAVALLASWAYVRRDSKGSSAWMPSRQDVVKSVSKQWHGLVSGGISSVYLSLPTVVVGALAPAGVGAFALGDKFVKLAGTGVLPLTQVLQGWVPRAAPHEVAARVRRALLVAGGTGALAGGVLAALGTVAADLMSSGQLPLGFELTIPMGVILFCTLVSRVAGTGCLGAFKDYRSISASAALGAAVGLPLLLAGTHLFGPVGAMWAIAASETVVLGFQLFMVRRHVNKLK